MEFPIPLEPPVWRLLGLDKILTLILISYILVNLGVFCRIFNVLYKQTVKQRSQEGPTKCKSGVRERPHDEPENLSKKVAENLRKTKYVMLSPTQIKGSITVMILVGAGWVVGLFAIGPFEVFFKYLFCITNAGTFHLNT